MTEEVVQEVDTAEAFRAAAAEARKVMAAGPPVEETAPSPEPGSSPAIGAESVVPETTPPVVEEAKPQEPSPEVKDEITVDPEAAWNGYKDDEARKKALAETKAYAAKMANKARELEARLATPTEEKKPEVPEVQEQADVPYEDWVKTVLEKPETETQQRIARLATGYSQLVAEKVTPAVQRLAEQTQKVQEAKQVLKDREIAVKFLQGRKDQSLYEDDLRDAKEMYNESMAELNAAKNAEIDAKLELATIEQDRLAALGVLRNDSFRAHEAEIASRKDSASRKQAEVEQSTQQAEVDKAWEKAKLDVVTARGVDEAAQQVLKDAADGAIIRAANSGKSIPVSEFTKFIEESLKPFQVNQEKTQEKAREQAVRKSIAITEEPTPVKATSAKPNLDVQPISYDEWRTKARTMMLGKFS